MISRKRKIREYEIVNKIKLLLPKISSHVNVVVYNEIHKCIDEIDESTNVDHNLELLTEFYYQLELISISFS